MNSATNISPWCQTRQNKPEFSGWWRQVGGAATPAAGRERFAWVRSASILNVYNAAWKHRTAILKTQAQIKPSPLGAGPVLNELRAKTELRWMTAVRCCYRSCGSFMEQHTQRAHRRACLVPGRYSCRTGFAVYHTVGDDTLYVGAVQHDAFLLTPQIVLHRAKCREQTDLFARRCRGTSRYLLGTSCILRT